VGELIVIDKRPALRHRSTAREMMPKICLIITVPSRGDEHEGGGKQGSSPSGEWQGLRKTCRHGDTLALFCGGVRMTTGTSIVRGCGAGREQEMRVISLSEAKAHLGHYGRLCRSEEVIVSIHGVRTFQLSPLDEDDDLINELLEHNPDFQRLI